MNDEPTESRVPQSNRSAFWRAIGRVNPPAPLRWSAALVLFAVAIFSVRHLFSHTTDFRTNVWDAGHAILGGSDPYDVTAFHRLFPGQGWMPIYGPPHLWLCVVMAGLPLSVATGLWFLFSVIGMLIIGALAVRCFGGSLFTPAVVAVAAVLILSRPGRASLNQVTVYYVLASYVAWSQARRHPMVAAGAATVALGKPPFGLPLLGLLILTRAWPVVKRTVVLFVATCVPMLVWLALNAGSLGAVWHDIAGNLRYTDATAVDRLGAAGRIDAISLIARYVHDVSGIWQIVAFIMLVVLGAAALRRTTTEPAWSITAPVLLILSATALLSIENQGYDLLLLAWPFAAIFSLAWARAGRSIWMMLVPSALALVASVVPAMSTARLLGVVSVEAPLTTFTTACLLAALAGAAVHV
ncbi:MAG TPA: glycosyltransferase 87 family protein, partial [Acidimicrobiales bacterium]|nr:glycosyltransferase 87 family protein [Acidimicrobiales bacterium]